MTHSTGEQRPDATDPGHASADVPVLLFVGHGRSGSTVFERLLAQDPRLVALGEVKHLWHRGYVTDMLCGCGCPFHACPFWQELDQRAFAGGLSVADAQDLFDLRCRVCRPANVPRLLRDSLRRTAEPELRRYQDHLRAVYRAALAVSGASVVIDSSKDPMHALAVCTMPDVRLHVAHLVRDARGVSYSYARRLARPEIHWRAKTMPVFHPGRTAVAWSYRNQLSRALRRWSASYRLVRYEDFVSHPGPAVNQLRRDVGLPPVEVEPFTTGAAEMARVHSVSGNPNRFQDGPIRLRLDDKWRREMSRGDQRLVTLLAAPLLARYGYLPWRDPSPAARQSQTSQPA